MRCPARLALFCLAAAALAGCAVGPDSSYVAPVASRSDALVLGSAAAAFIADRLPPGSAVTLLPAASDPAGDEVTPALDAALRQHGFQVATSSAPAPSGAHRVRYLVAPLDNGELVRVTLDGATEGARFFTRDTAGGLQVGGPYTVTQAETAEAAR